MRHGWPCVVRLLNFEVWISLLLGREEASSRAHTPLRYVVRSHLSGDTPQRPVRDAAIPRPAEIAWSWVPAAPIPRLTPPKRMFSEAGEAGYQGDSLLKALSSSAGGLNLGYRFG